MAATSPTMGSPALLTHRRSNSASTNSNSNPSMPTKFQRLIDRGVEYVFGRVTLLLRRRVRKRDRKIWLLKAQLEEARSLNKDLQENIDRINNRNYHARRALDGNL